MSAIPVHSITVFLAALVTALATGIGAVPFAFRRSFSIRALGLSNAAAAGLMIAASVMLIWEGIQYSTLMMLIGAASGILFIALSSVALDGKEHLKLGTLRSADARKAFLIVTVMTIHSFTEGVGVGVSFVDSSSLGVFITTAIAVHNIPEGLAISLVLIPRGLSVWRAAGWSIFSSLPQPVMAVPAFLFVSLFEPLLPVGLGFAAGAMAWMTRTELIPDALSAAPKHQVLVSSIIGFSAMMGFQVLLKMAS